MRHGWITLCEVSGKHEAWVRWRTILSWGVREAWGMGVGYCYLGCWGSLRYGWGEIILTWGVAQGSMRHGWGEVILTWGVGEAWGMGEVELTLPEVSGKHEAWVRWSYPYLRCRGSMRLGWGAPRSPGTWAPAEWTWPQLSPSFNDVELPRLTATPSGKQQDAGYNGNYWQAQNLNRWLTTGGTYQWFSARLCECTGDTTVLH